MPFIHWSDYTIIIISYNVAGEWFLVLFGSEYLARKFYEPMLIISFLIQICEKQKQGGWTTVWNTQQQVPYAYNGLQWVGYENPQSVKVKADYAIANNLAGVMIWSIEDEDHKNVCGGGVYPLMNAIKNALKSVNIK